MGIRAQKPDVSIQEALGILGKEKAPPMMRGREQFVDYER